MTNLNQMVGNLCGEISMTVTHRSSDRPTKLPILSLITVERLPIMSIITKIMYV